MVFQVSWPKSFSNDRTVGSSAIGHLAVVLMEKKFFLCQIPPFLLDFFTQPKQQRGIILSMYRLAIFQVIYADDFVCITKYVSYHLVVSIFVFFKAGWSFSLLLYLWNITVYPRFVRSYAPTKKQLMPNQPQTRSRYCVFSLKTNLIPIWAKIFSYHIIALICLCFQLFHLELSITQNHNNAEL